VKKLEIQVIMARIQTPGARNQAPSSWLQSTVNNFVLHSYTTDSATRFPDVTEIDRSENDISDIDRSVFDESE